MQRKRLFWFLVSLIFFGGFLYFWHLGNKWEAEKNAHHTTLSSNAPGTNATNTASPHGKVSGSRPLVAQRTNSAPSTNAITAKTRYPYRLTNTDEPVGKLVHNDKAILLVNALIDTGKPMNLAIPDRLRAPANSGSYVVQSRGPLNDQFRSLLQSANATIVSYIPNNAYLVRVSDSGAQQISADAQTQSVLPFEPYYKLDDSLLKMAMEQPDQLPTSRRLNLTLFADTYQQTVVALQQLGATVVATDSSPFGPWLTVQAAPGTLSKIASLEGVQGVAESHSRKLGNDLDRVTVGDSFDSVTNENYLGLTGTNVFVNINDSGVDTNHPDLQGRIFSDFAGNFTDINGHGTHVAGTILGNGSESFTVTNAVGSVTNANFRGMAPNANALVLSLFDVDSYLQETAARSNVFISNNSWNYGSAYSYDIAAASYDAAVRDALPGVTGAQPVLYVFSAGNDGGGYPDGTGGYPDSILSPGTAKNVITVGAAEQPRLIPDTLLISVTNTTDSNGVSISVTNYITNSYFFDETDNGTQVADFSSRGNVGINVEGTYGRFKPDLVAPGTFVISCRSQEWDSNAYYNPTNYSYYVYTNNVVGTGTNITPFIVAMPLNAVELVITLRTNILTGATNLPPMPIYVGDNTFPNDSLPSGTNRVVLNDTSTPVSVFAGDTVFFDVGNLSSNAVNFDVEIELVTTNDVGNYYEFLGTLNDNLGPYYRYESGTSMAAAGVSGMLACMQEFFQSRMHVTNSPALMKALLINGARSLSDQYGLSPTDQNQPTFQGWGLPSLPNTIPSMLTNLNSGNMDNMPLQFFDQSPTNALATGQSFTRKLALTPDGAGQDLRVTLVWTDPPGNPSAGVKLVNDLDLIVSNLDTGEVFLGNDIPAGSRYSQAWDTNSIPNIDSVNNVENVFLQSPLGTNYTITVMGHRVNVNAVTADTNNIVQDFALVISSGDANNTNGFKLTVPDNGGFVANNPVTNVFLLSNNVPALNQRVGANSQFSGSTNGTAVQWNFYIYTNTPALTNASFTNVAFVTFQPPNLGVPVMGASTEVAPPDPNATRFAGADIDLYVSTDHTLTNLDPNAVALASKAVGRTGSEVVYFTNSSPGQVYYIGVKSEDQQAAQFNLIGFATDVPFSQMTPNGDAVVNMNTTPLTVPGGIPTQPSSAFLIGICVNDIQVRKAVVTNTVTCTYFGDYIGSLNEGSKAAVLNNHSVFTNIADFTETLVYDDSGEGEFPGSITSAGPGSLNDFVGLNAMGSAWIYTIVNDSQLDDVGTINQMSLLLEHEPKPNTGPYRLPPLAANAWYFGFVDVPPNATNLTISISGNTGPIDMLIQKGSFPSFTSYLKEATFPTPGGSLSLSIYDDPPLSAGRYFFAIHTHNAEADLTLDVELTYSLSSRGAQLFYSSEYMPLLDDAVTNSSIYVPQSSTVVSAEVGVRIDHPRESDLVLTLISPQGTRVLLSENRGGTDTNGYGSGTNTVLAVSGDSGGAAFYHTNVDVGANFGVINMTYNFYAAPDQMTIYYDGTKIWDTGMISNPGSFAVPFGPGNSQSIDIYMNEFGNPATNDSTVDDKWDFNATIEKQSLSYTVFTENTNLTQTPIKFAVPPFGGAAATLPAQTNILSSFEGDADGPYGAGSVIPFNNTSANGWTVAATNAAVASTVPTVVSVPQFAYDASYGGSNVLALHGGTISCVMPTVAGRQYTLTLGNHGRPSLTPVSWWNGDGNSDDSVGGNNLANQFGGQVVYTNGVVGQAFSLQGNTKLRAPDAVNLVLTNEITVEGWVSPQSASSAIILSRGDNRSAFDAYTLAVQPPTTGGDCDLRWYVDDTDNNSAWLAGPLSFNVFTHVAGTYSWNDTNATMNLYIDGQLVATTDTTVRPIGALISGQGPGVGLGNEGDVINNFGFTGLLDEITLYSNALSAAQVQNIYAAGSAGKDPVGYTPQVTADVIIGGVTNMIAGIDEWTPQIYHFTATSNNMVLTIVPHEDGMLIDSVQLLQDAQANPANDYLPEESLDKLAGENARGQWQLEVLDNRAGATNPAPTLVSWQLSLMLSDKVPAPIPLQNGVIQSNSVAPGGITYFVVNVPSWANFATNIISASGPVNLLFNQNAPSTAGDVQLLGSVTSDFRTLRTSGTPPLVPGQTYYLGVQNTGTTPVDFTITVDFDIIPLANMVPFANSVAIGSVQYYQFDVTAPTAVEGLFQILNPSGNVVMLVSKGLPLPDMNDFDYISAVSGASPQNILVITNSSPVPIGPGRWYIGVFNNDASAVTYAVEATEVDATNLNIIPLNDGIPLAVTKWTPSDPGTNYFLFSITNTETAAALFELYNLSGNVDLTLQHGAIPFGPPYFAISSKLGTNSEQIVLRTNTLGTNILGDWYLGVPNNAGANVNFTIRAVTSTNGMLLSDVPINVTVTLPSSPGSGPTLSWPGVAGDLYEVDYATNLASPDWNVLTTFVAGGSPVTFTDPNPISSMRFYRIRVLPTP